MVQGLFWILLLIFFLVLAGLGWLEYQKIEAYRIWAIQFDQAKYDIYAMLGLKGDQLTWAKPTRWGPVEVNQISLKQVEEIYLSVDDQQVNPEALPQRGKRINLSLRLRSGGSAVDCPPVLQIPFTEVSLAARWLSYLQTSLAS
jgi:hypothetical protein